MKHEDYDLLVIGGGITGAGVLLEAARRGLKALLVEQRDFAWGTSSRSSKLVHGGLRYLAEGRLRLTRESVREREALLRDAPGLVEPQGFAFADYGASRRKRRSFLAGLAIYDLMAGRREQHWLDAEDFAMLAPNIERAGLAGGIRYTDAKTDDARLVLRVLDEARSHGAQARNYVAVEALQRAGGRVTGALLRDARTGDLGEVSARVVVNATGAWACGIAGQGNAPRLRPLRGSHLVLPAWRLPLAQAVSLMHPLDGRPVFAFPWEGVTLVGTTDVDHGDGLALEARITRGEFDYLMAALRAQFPQLDLQEGDVLATYAGVRPVLDSGLGVAPSKEAREHLVWDEPGLVAVTGGKLTTFRAIALDTLGHVARQLADWHADLAPQPVFSRQPIPLGPRGTPTGLLQRLAGRHGGHAQAVVDAAQAGELEIIPGTLTPWAELRWAARSEAVHRLEDLLLRRTRLGLQLRAGASALLPRIRAVCQPELGWDDACWEAEQAAYLALWQAHYGIPNPQKNEPHHA
ncbi:glycerol-3-phosphate dehydrogenase/oxidase [Telluria aromaticivorans]|uniref:Glycerol-3-phosphate dehydrogenase/oxidase n=1 Tax=Telluria aromaticivorans TaxID=2725995 RepID=A0A7Y2JW33_9BURK|nr:glycerol-3-phosphate dehydrogenase/oxidase [Telluria aromaticivorans]NNG22102.1 glycerol-3-phosphate dehydrogenase/oxidase [Telluria aromaticivorans]